MKIFKSWWLSLFLMSILLISVPLLERTGDQGCLEDKNLHIQEVQQTLSIKNTNKTKHSSMTWKLLADRL